MTLTSHRTKLHETEGRQQQEEHPYDFSSASLIIAALSLGFPRPLPHLYLLTYGVVCRPPVR